MYRRRRPRSREIAFSFDSFLDLVTNVMGIILRLILVAWVGAKSYSGFFRPPESAALDIDEQPAAVVVEQPKLTTEAEKAALDQARKKLAEARAALLEHLRQQESLESRRRDIERHASELRAKGDAVKQQSSTLDEAKRQASEEQARVEMSLTEIRRRGEELRKEIAAMERQPVKHNVLRYQTPVARTFQSEELHFECKNGRVTFIDVDSMVREIRQGLRAKGELLKNNWEMTDRTSPMGAFYLRYVIQRERGLIDGITNTGTPDDQGNYRFGVSGWEVVPIRADRGEAAEAALTAESEFRRIVDHLDPMQTAVTFWVYPDSFPLYRQLRDHCLRRDLLVAGRPLPEGVPIASSRSGSASRGQ
jgi:hypothetical protein